MKIVVDSGGEYKDMINSYYDLERYNDDSEECVLFLGYKTSNDEQLKKKFAHIPKRIYINLEAPCSFTGTKTAVSSQNYFTHVYTICPYTAEWLKDKSDTKYIPIPFPFNADSFKHLDYSIDKEYDVMYMGTIMDNAHKNMLFTMKKHKYILTSLFQYPGVTHVNINSAKKWELLSKSKASIAMNVAPIAGQHKNFIKQYNKWDENEAFKHLDVNYIPQFKPRVIESMMCKTLVLVKKDPWNVIEKWFEPDKHFIYWDNLQELNTLLEHIKHNLDTYQDIVDAAYSKVQEYEIHYLYKNLIHD